MSPEFLTEYATTVNLISGLNVQALKSFSAIKLTGIVMIVTPKQYTNATISSDGYILRICTCRVLREIQIYFFAFPEYIYKYINGLLGLKKARNNT